MKKTLLFLVVGLCSSGLAVAQGTIGGAGGGGYGGGGFGGGGFGGVGGRDQSEKVVTGMMILTPGDVVEFPLEISKNEGLRAEVRSSVFDPAVEIVDALGAVIFEQDDPAPGRQNPKFFVRFPAPGSYKLRVKSFRSAAGGQFTLNGWRLSCIDLGDIDIFGELEEYRSTYVEVHLKESVIYSVIRRTAWDTSMGNAITATDERWDSVTSIVAMEKFAGSRRPYESTPTSTTFLSKESQVLFIPVEAYANQKLALSVKELKPVPIGTQVSFEDGHPVIFTDNVAKYALIEYRSGGAKGTTIEWVWFDAAPSKAESKPAEYAHPYDFLHTDPKDRGVMRLTPHLDGRVYILARNANLGKKILDVERRPFGTPWTKGDRIEGKLNIGECHYYLLDVPGDKQFELIAESDDFDIVMGTTGNGGSSEMDDYEGSRNARMFVEMTISRQMIFSVRALGDGAKGNYRISKRLTEIPSLRTGDQTKVHIKSGNVALLLVPAVQDEPYYIEVEGIKDDVVLSYSFRDPKSGSVQLTRVGPNAYGGVINAQNNTSLVLRFSKPLGESTVTVRTSKLPFHK